MTYADETITLHREGMMKQEKGKKEVIPSSLNNFFLVIKSCQDWD